MNETQKARLFAGANALLICLAAAAILIMLNYLSARHYRRFDLKKADGHQLSEKTIQVLKGLQEPVTVSAVLADAEAQPQVREEIAALLERYKGYNDKLKVVHLDPDRNRLEIQRLGIINLHTVVFEGKSGRQVVNAGTLTESDDSAAMFGGPQTLKSFKGEEAFTNALASLSESKRTVCFATGHGERDPQSHEGEGLAALSAYIEGENYAVRPQPVAGAEALPSDCAVLVIAGPQIPYAPAEADKLEAYQRSGGRLLFMLDPNPARDGSGFIDTGFEKFLSGRGLTLHRDLALDPKAQAQTNAAEPMFYAMPSSAHVISQALGRGGQPQVILPIARSLGLPPPPAAGDAAPPSQWEPLLSSSPEGFGVTDLKSLRDGVADPSPSDIPGPLVLGAAYGGRDMAGKELETGERIVVFGSSRFAGNLFQTTRNPDLVLNAIHWLAARPARIAIPPKKLDSENLMMTGRQAKFAALWLVLVAPAAAALGGVLLFLRRRQG